MHGGHLRPGQLLFGEQLPQAGVHLLGRVIGERGHKQVFASPRQPGGAQGNDTGLAAARPRIHGGGAVIVQHGGLLTVAEVFQRGHKLLLWRRRGVGVVAGFLHYGADDGASGPGNALLAGFGHDSDRVFVGGELAIVAVGSFHGRKQHQHLFFVVVFGVFRRAAAVESVFCLCAECAA